LRGEVVGINSQIYSRSGGFMGISFAIPIDEAMRVADQLRSNGKVTRGRIGIQIDNVSKELAQSIGLSKPAGALVRSVEAGSPAEKAGIEAGDIVLKVDGKAVEKAGDLSRMIGNIKPGAKTTLQVHRRGALKDITSQIGEFESEDAPKSGKAEDKKGSEGKSTLLGMSITDLTDTQKRDLKLKGGVIIESIDAPASQAGLREGDVILSIENAEILDSKQLSAITSKLDTSKPVRVLARRGDWVNYHIIRPKP
jgi:serine protease Do